MMEKLRRQRKSIGKLHESYKKFPDREGKTNFKGAPKFSGQEKFLLGRLSRGEMNIKEFEVGKYRAFQQVIPTLG